MDIELEVPGLSKNYNPKIQHVMKRNLAAATAAHKLRVKRDAASDMKLELAVVVDRHARQTMLDHTEQNMNKAVNIMLAIANGVQASPINNTLFVALEWKETG